MDPNVKLISEKYAQLPSELQQQITNPEWERSVVFLANEHQLNSEQTQEIVDETLLVLLGITNQFDLALNIEAAAGVGEEIAQGISQKIQAKIFEPIRHLLESLNPSEEDIFNRLGFSSQEMRLRFEALPLELKNAITAVETETIIQQIGQKYRLHLDQLGVLADEIFKVMIGASPASQLTPSIQQKTGVGMEIAESLNADVNREIFAKIRSNLQTLTSKPADQLPTREEVLGEIENPKPAEVLPPVATTTPTLPPVPTPAPTEVAANQSVTEQKLNQMFHLPRVETAERSAETKPVDPYREPTE